MSQQRIPKTGLAKRMRAWMQSQKRPFTPRQICEGLGIPKGRERDRLRNAIPDFLSRGEIERTGRGKYRYNHAWRAKRKSRLKASVLKAMYVSVSEFSTADVQRLSEVTDKAYINRIVRELRDSGYIRQVGRRICAHGSGAEYLYNIPDRERFRIELMD